MTLKAQLQYCQICQNRKFSAQQGIVCGLTDAKPSFEQECPDFNIDKAEAERKAAQEKEIEEQEEMSGGFAPEKAGIKKGVTGGIIMMVIAVVWFVVGYQAGRIFYYPPVLFLIGLYALIKGIWRGNIAGEK